jgi:hypothetical protein
MPIPQTIQRKHIERALEAIREAHEIPPHRESTKYDILYKGRRYPPKYVLSLAHRFLPPGGKELRGFRGGFRTNKFLNDRDFEIVRKDGKATALVGGHHDSSPKLSDDSVAKGNRPARARPANPNTTLRPLSHKGQLDFTVRTRQMIRVASKTEAKLVEEYKRWLEKQRRKLKIANYCGLECDAYEEERKNLIEAKSSIKREYIRMAVGQLLDYAYLGRATFGKPSLAILLPRRPEPKLLDWLAELKIAVIWKHKRTFVDNANGQFTS